MSKSELKSLGPIFYLPRRNALEFKKTASQLKELLKDNPVFAKHLAEQCLLLGKEVYFNEIKDLVYKEYYKPDSSDYSFLRSLLSLTFNFATLLDKSNFVVQQNYHDLLHQEIETLIHNIFNEENSNVDIIG